MQVRCAAAIDAQAIAEVQVETWQHAYSEVFPAEYLARLSVARRTAMWADAVSRGLPRVMVADVGGQVAGFSAIGPCRDEGSSARDYELWAIYVAPRYWSKGIGLALWLASRQHAIERGASSVSLWVIARNSRAITFYRSAGFEAVEDSLRAFELGGVRVEEMRYVQPLDG